MKLVRLICFLRGHDFSGTCVNGVTICPRCGAERYTPGVAAVAVRRDDR